MTLFYKGKIVEERAGLKNPTASQLKLRQLGLQEI